MSKQDFAQGKARMVRKMLAIGYQMSYQLAETAEERAMQPWQVNKAHVNRWCLHKGPVRKQLDDMTYNDLVTSVTVFEKVYHDFLKTL